MSTLEAQLRSLPVLGVALSHLGGAFPDHPLRLKFCDFAFIDQETMGWWKHPDLEALLGRVAMQVSARMQDTNHTDYMDDVVAV